MKLIVASVGKMKSGPEQDLVARYATRCKQIAGPIGFSAPKLIEISESRARQTAARKAEEASTLRNRIPTEAYRIVFDERGETLTSEKFAALLEHLRDVGRDVAFVVGGPDGLDPSLRDTASSILSFGAMTMPHQIVRIILLEQLYRALTILSGHPYHRA